MKPIYNAIHTRPDASMEINAGGYRRITRQEMLYHAKKQMADLGISHEHLNGNTYNNNNYEYCEALYEQGVERVYFPPFTDWAFMVSSGAMPFLSLYEKFVPRHQTSEIYNAAKAIVTENDIPGHPSDWSSLAGWTERLINDVNYRMGNRLLTTFQFNLCVKMATKSAARDWGHFTPMVAPRIKLRQHGQQFNRDE